MNPKRLALVLCLLLIAAGCATATPRPEAATDLREYDVAALQAAMAEGELSSAGIVAWYLAEIERIDRPGRSSTPSSRSTPTRWTSPRALDAERAASGPRGPLHGIPVMLKDNIDTGDRMQTTAGSLALAGSIAGRGRCLPGRASCARRAR